MANSVTARFNDDCKVHVAMSDDTTVTKAVIIDAEGNETDIGGGGGGDSNFSIVKVTVDASALEPGPEYPCFVAIPRIISVDDTTGNLIINNPQTQDVVTYDVPLYKGSTIVYEPASTVEFQVVSGNAQTSGDGSAVTIHGDCSIKYVLKH